MDDDERHLLRYERLDPDDRAVVAALDLVRWELLLLPTRRRGLAHRVGGVPLEIETGSASYAPLVASIF